MRLDALRIENFRNLRSIDVALSGSPVVVGENGSGKSNLVHALRLVLDPNLTYQQRMLTSEDFSDELGPTPMMEGLAISISVDLVDFESDLGLLATLASARPPGDPDRARLTYVFQPRPSSSATNPPTYEWKIFAGDDSSNTFRGDLRPFLHLSYMQALRDSEADLASWRRSPLRPILDEVARSIPSDQVEVVRAALETARLAVNNLDAVVSASDKINQSSSSLVGGANALDPSLQLAPTDPARALRNLKLLLDGPSQRELSRSSLGVLNVLYLALLQAELDRRLGDSEIEYALIAIEEPEAHLHPHLQRRMFRGVQAAEQPRSSALVTTHSPHIVSVVDPRRIVRLASEPNGVRAFSARDASLSDKEWEDIQRYLDATRSELVFARKVLFVEGYAEQVLLQQMAHDRDFDESGVTICAVHGTHFKPYVEFARSLGLKYAVVTDGDPFVKGGRTGADRVAALCKELGGQADDAESLGIFMGDHTLEVDLFECSNMNQRIMIDTVKSLYEEGVIADKIEQAAHSGTFPGVELLKRVRGKKGVFAQRLAANSQPLEPPPYISAALEWIGL